MSSEELNFQEWALTVNQKLTFALLSIKEHKEITEADYDLLKFFHRQYYLGEIPLFKSKMDLPVENVSQTILFGQKTTTEADLFTQENGT
jgi:hypothetical protein